MLDDNVDKKLRALQAKMIQTETKSVSFSKLISETEKRDKIIH